MAVKAKKAGRPRREDTVQVMFRLPPDLVARLDAAAVKLGQTRTAVARSYLERGLDQKAGGR